MKRKMNVVPIEKINPLVQENRKIEARKKLVNLLFVFFLLALVVVYFQSDYSRVEALEIKGNSITEQTEIIKWSGFKKNDYFLKIQTSRMKERLEKHGEIKNVTFKRVFPNKISVIVEEYQQFAFLIEKGKKYPVLENAFVLKENTEILNSSPILQDFKQDEYLVDTVSEFRKLPKDILLCVSEIQYTPSDIDKNKLTIFMNDGMQVLVTITKISNLKFYPDYISNVPEGVKGILDLEVGSFFKPFEEMVNVQATGSQGEQTEQNSDGIDAQNSSNQNGTNQNTINNGTTGQNNNAQNSSNQNGANQNTVNNSTTGQNNNAQNTGQSSNNTNSTQ